MPMPPPAHPFLHTLLQTAVDGIAVGSLYALIALGYTLVFGILQFINFAHGDVFALGAWVSLTVAARLQRHVWGPLATGMTFVAAVAGCAGLGFVIEQLAYRPLRNAPRLNVLITAIGVSLLLENVGQLHWAFGTQQGAVPTLVRVLHPVGADGAMVNDTTLHLAARGVDVSIQKVDRIVFVTAVAIMVGLQLLIYRTKFGTAMRAVSYNAKAAALMGINVDRVVSGTFVLGSALAGAAGFLFAVRLQGQTVPPTAASAWVLLGMKAFVAAVVGGIGNVRGATLGGLLIGLVEQFGAGAGNLMYQARWTSTVVETSGYKDVYVFALLIVVLLVRPSGLLGRSTVEKV